MSMIPASRSASGSPQAVPIDASFVVNLILLVHHQPLLHRHLHSLNTNQMADAASGSADKSVQVKLVLLGTSLFLG